MDSPPVGHVVDQVLLEHEAPLLDDVEQRLLEGPAVHPEPGVEDVDGSYLVHLAVDLLVRVHLHPEKKIQPTPKHIIVSWILK